RQKALGKLEMTGDRLGLTVGLARGSRLRIASLLSSRQFAAGRTELRLRRRWTPVYLSHGAAGASASWLRRALGGREARIHSGALGSFRRASGECPGPRLAPPGHRRTPRGIPARRDDLAAAV